MLALTTIIFAQYYDKSAERSNELLWEIRETISKKFNANLIQSLFNKMVYVSANRVIFNSTLFLFRLISYILAGLWSIACFGYINSNNNLPLTDIMVISSGTILLIIVLLALPSIIAYVRRRLPIIIKNGGCSLLDAKRLLIDDSSMTMHKFITEVMQLRLKVQLTGSSFCIYFGQEIPINKYLVMLSLRSSAGQALFIRLNIKAFSENYRNGVKYHLKDSLLSRYDWIHWFTWTNTCTEIPSLLSLLDDINISESRIYIMSSDKKTKLVSKIDVSQDNAEYQFTLGQEVISSIEGEILARLEEAKDVLEISYEGNQYFYSLTK